METGCPHIMSGRKTSLATALVLTVFLSAAATPQRRAGRRGRAGATSPATAQSRAVAVAGRGLACNVFCSTKNPGTAVAEITRKVADVEPGQEVFAANVSRQELEVTVYRDGFSRGLFANLLSADRDAGLRRLNDSPAQGGGPGLEGLTVTEVRRRGDDEGARRESRFNEGLSGARASRLRGGATVVVRVEGLEPGLNYFWRVPAGSGRRRAAGQVVQCKAPVCPVDSRPLPTNP